jgi:glycosyltransferase involved in cell wall biosynthesis
MVDGWPRGTGLNAKCHGVRRPMHTTDRRPDAPSVSVLIPAYNPAAGLEDALSSALAQTISNIEVIVIDDGSTERLEHRLASLQDPRVHIVRHPTNLGVSAARNTGLDYARAPIIALLDSDDTWCRDHLARSLALLERETACFVYGNAALKNHPYGKPRMYSDVEVHSHPVSTIRQLARNNPIINSSVVTQADKVRLAGGWPTWLRIGEDWWLYLNLLANGARFALQDQALVTYKWPTNAEHSSAHASRVAVDQLKLAWALARRWPARDLPLAKLFAEPIFRYLIAWLPWSLRKRLRNLWVWVLKKLVVRLVKST